MGGESERLSRATNGMVVVVMSRKMVVARWATGKETGQERGGGGGRRVLAGEKEASS